MVNICAIFQASSLNHFPDTKGSQHLKSKSRDPSPTIFDLFLNVFDSAPHSQCFCLQPFHRYGGGPKIPKVGHLTPPGPPLTYCWIFVVSAPHYQYLCQISSF